MAVCNVLVPQLLWWRKLRRSVALIFVISIFVNVGMWFERFVIIVTSLHRDFLPSSWVMYSPTLIEIATLAGSFGLFFTCFLVFVRFIPFIAIGEVKGVLGYGRQARTVEAPSRLKWAARARESGWHAAAGREARAAEPGG
jgi:molybdopterin-containing oxidoreductase family membrane subunit